MNNVLRMSPFNCFIASSVTLAEILCVQSIGSIIINGVTFAPCTLASVVLKSTIEMLYSFKIKLTFA